MTTLRTRAARLLVAVDRRRRTLAAELEPARRELPDPRDRALLTELATGVCRWRAELDALLTQVCTRPLTAVDAETLATLRLAVYQLRHLDRIPAHAVVHDAVETARALGSERAAGFVNGVLRGYLRRADTLTLPARPADGASRRQQIDYLNVTCAHPRWLVARWLDRYGFEAAEAWCEWNNQPPHLTVRALDPAVTDTVDWLATQGITASRSPVMPDLARLEPGAFGAWPAEVRAAVAIQDEGSALVAAVVQARPGDRVLDLCASPGGKSVRLWRAMHHTGVLVSSDTRPARVHLLRQTLRAAGAPARVVRLDGRQPLPFPAAFDHVLVDAPCSGLGTLRRDPDIKWHVSLEDLPALAAAQRDLLQQAAAVVRPGGHLVYATCSSEPEENEGVVAQFLHETPGWTVVAWTGPGGDSDGALRTTPVRDRLDAFYACRLARATA